MTHFLVFRSCRLAGVASIVTVSAQKAQRPIRLTDFTVTLSVPGLNELRHREGILRASKNCLIHNTLVHAPLIAIELAEFPGQAEEQRQAFAEAP